jgi:hypothetical protein
MFERIMDRRGARRASSLNVLQYRAYSLIGLGQYDEAVRELETLRSTGSNKLFDFWPRLALAYCHLKLRHDREFDAALHSAVTHEQASEYRNMVGVLYPELAELFTERLRSGQIGSNPQI